MRCVWTRRDWLTHQAGAAAALIAPGMWPSAVTMHDSVRTTTNESQRTLRHPPSHTAQTIAAVAPGLMQQLALTAVDAAQAAGAQYADTRLTRTVVHRYSHGQMGYLRSDSEEVGVGVRAFVNGYWGFASSPYWTTDEMARLAHDAVAIAKANARGPIRAAELGTIPTVTGTWATPVRIDPFTVSIEEKLDFISSLHAHASRVNVDYRNQGETTQTTCARQERVLATSEGTLVTQTLYESGGKHDLQSAQQEGVRFDIDLGWSGRGWELFLDAKLPEQFGPRLTAALELAAQRQKPAIVGRYTLVCQGTVMASLAAQTFGVATQLDRALGYEANARGTSFVTDPLAMVGTFALASPLITLTARRTAPTQLATVQWDDEGVVPSDITLVKEGILTDFQTTREQAAWLTPYYRQQGRAIHSHGCAAAEDALAVTLQHMPNLVMAPSASGAGLGDLIATVKNGILIEQGYASQLDSQARNGVIQGEMREIKNGRVGSRVIDGAFLFNTLDFWKRVSAIGDSTTRGDDGVLCLTFGESFPRGNPRNTRALVQVRLRR